MSINNHVHIEGYIGQEPKIHTTQSGKKIISFTVAVQKSRKNDRGEWEQETHWFSVKQFDPTEYMEQRAVKGAYVGVEGSLAVEKWTDKDGNNREKVVIISASAKVYNLIKQGDAPPYPDRTASTYAPGYQPSHPAKEYGGENVFPTHKTAVQDDAGADDDLPF